MLDLECGYSLRVDPGDSQIWSHVRRMPNNEFGNGKGRHFNSD